MNYEELMKQVEEMPKGRVKAYREIISCAGVGGKVWPYLEEHLEKANTVDEFLDLMYQDENCRFEKIWGMWAKEAKKDWRIFFKAEMIFEGALIERGGLVIEMGEGMFLLPVRGLRGKDRTVDIIVYPDDGFNLDVAEYYGSITGPFTLCDYTFEGTYDIYRAGRTLVLEHWAFDSLGYRKRRRSQQTDCCPQV